MNENDVQAVQVHLREFADDPLYFDQIPDWLREAVTRKVVVPVFLSEDYWYLKVYSPDRGRERLAGPGDWLVHIGRGIYPVSDAVYQAYTTRTVVT